jgi:competence protein ComEA
MIHLTHQERKVFLFLSFLFFAGVALTVFKKSTGCNLCLIDLYSQKAAGAIVDVNTAGRDALIALPGIGEKAADDIIAYRTAHNGIKDLSELTNIKGISEKKLDNLKKYLSVN